MKSVRQSGRFLLCAAYYVAMREALADSPEDAAILIVIVTGRWLKRRPAEGD
jgi:hypothetical protein